MISEFLKYLELELNRSRRTVEAYGDDLRELSHHLEMGDNLEYAMEISTADIRGWIAEMARRGLSPRSLRRKTQSARAFFRWLQKRGLIKNNPATEVQLAKIGRKLPEFVRVQEMEEILNSGTPDEHQPREMRNHLIVTMFYATGMRLEELRNVTDADINIHSKEIRVHGKRDKTRIIPVADSLMDQIKEWQKVRDANYPLTTPAPLFCSKHGKISARSIYEIVHKALQSTGATHKSPHALRHTFATALLNGGAEINSVKELLGHASLQSTQIYTHLSFADMKKAYEGAHPRANILKNNKK